MTKWTTVEEWTMRGHRDSDRGQREALRLTVDGHGYELSREAALELAETIERGSGMMPAHGLYRRLDLCRHASSA